MIKKWGKTVAWDGPPRKAVPRGGLKDQRKPVVAVSRLKRAGRKRQDIAGWKV
jgi:hypothetical protein